MLAATDEAGEDSGYVLLPTATDHAQGRADPYHWYGVRDQPSLSANTLLRWAAPTISYVRDALLVLLPSSELAVEEG